MENRNMKNLLNHIKKYDLVRKYQLTFDKYFDFEKLLLIDDKDVDRIIGNNEYYSLIELYEIINSIKINNEIKEYICLLDDNEVIKYCLRLSTLDDFNSDEEKCEYVKALSESNSDSVRFTYGVASSKLYINSEDGLLYVKMISKCKSDVLVQLIDILHTKKYREDEEFFEFINIVKDAKEGYIAEYMVDLFKNEDTQLERLSISNMALLMASKGRKQAYYAKNILTNEKLTHNGTSESIAKILVSCEDEEKAYNIYSSILNDKISLNEIANIVNDDRDEKVNIIALFKSRNIDEILRVLNTIPDNEQIKRKIKVR